MKYYYGNSYKEAMSNNPVEITDTKVLAAYQEVYDCVVPAGPELPDEVQVDVEFLDWEPGDGDDMLPAAIGEWMHDEYGYGAYSMDMKMSDDGKIITLTNIDWNTDEEEVY